MSTPTKTAHSPDPVPATDSGDFRIQATLEILTLMRRLQAERSRLMLSTPDGLHLQSMVCEIDADNGGLLLDLPTDKPALQALLAAEEVTAAAYLDQIRLQFEIEGLMLVHGAERQARGDGALLRATLPSVLFRFQRRQAFRVRPASRTPQARFTLPEAPEQTLTLRVLDLSLGGLALQITPDLPAPAAGSLITGARVELDRHTHLQVDLRVQHLRKQADGSRQLGVLFENLAPLAARDLQHYIEHVQKMARLLRNKVAT